MENITIAGRYLYAIAMIVFGLQHLIYNEFLMTLIPVPSMPGRIVLIYLVGIWLIASGILLMIKSKAEMPATLLGAFFFLVVIFLHVYLLVGNIYSPGEWTGAAEVVALGAGAWIIAGDVSLYKPSPAGWNNKKKVSMPGRVIFALSLIVFSALHFMYADFIGGLIPAWIPAKVLLAYLVGVGFLGAAISIGLNIKVEWSAAALAFMFIFWVIFLHIPRALAAIENKDELTSTCVALAMAGISLTLWKMATKKVAVPK